MNTFGLNGLRVLVLNGSLMPRWKIAVFQQVGATGQSIDVERAADTVNFLRGEQGILELVNLAQDFLGGRRGGLRMAGNGAFRLGKQIMADRAVVRLASVPHHADREAQVCRGEGTAEHGESLWRWRSHKDRLRYPA